MGEDYDYLFKCIVVGDGGVGKTALTLRFSKGFFTEDYKMTIGVDFHVKTIKVDTQEGDTLAAKLQIWDTGGQERFSSIRPMYYRGSLGALLIFDLTSMASFEHLPQWIEEVRANVQNNIPLLLVGNKSDLEDQRQVSLAEINDFTKKFDLYYMETSAKTGEGVGDCFSVLAYLMIGQGVPDTLLSEDTVFSPGNVLVGAPQTVQPKASINVDQPVAETSTNFEPEAEYEYDAPPIPEPITNQPTVQSASESQPLSEKNFQPKSHKAVIFDENEAIRAEEKYEYDAPPVPEVKGNFRPETESQLDPEIPLPKMEQPKTSKSVEEFEFKMPDEIIDQEEGSSIPTFSSSKASIKTLESSSFSPKSVPFTASTPEPAPAPKEFIPSIESSEKDLDSEISPLLFTSSQPGNKPTKSSDSLVDYLPKPMFEEEDKKKKKKKKEKKKKDKKKEKKKELEEEKKEQQNLFDEMRSVGKKEKESKSKVSATPEETIQPAGSLFDTLKNKANKPSQEVSRPFFSFSAKNPAESQEQTEKKEESKLRIIPNVEDFETSDSAPSELSSSTYIPQPQQEHRPEIFKREKQTSTVICPSCGSVLSSEYSFCNRCGRKL